MNYEDFDQYLLQGEPGKRDKAQAWKTAIGLQEVDGLTPSVYLLETAKRHIDGDITIDEVRSLLDSYYNTLSNRSDDANTEEADKVSANITKLLNDLLMGIDPYGTLPHVSEGDLPILPSLKKDSYNDGLLYEIIDIKKPDHEK